MMNNTLFSRIAFLYVGSSNFETDLHFYRYILGAKLIWGFDRFEAKVAAFQLGDSPLILIADHLTAPSIMPIFEVKDLTLTIKILTSRGWRAEREPIEIPNGTCYVFQDPSGNRYAIFDNIRPLAMENAYEDPTNTHRIL